MSERDFEILMLAVNEPPVGGTFQEARVFERTEDGGGGHPVEIQERGDVGRRQGEIRYLQILHPEQLQRVLDV